MKSDNEATTNERSDTKRHHSRYVLFLYKMFNSTVLPLQVIVKCPKRRRNAKPNITTQQQPTHPAHTRHGDKLSPTRTRTRTQNVYRLLRAIGNSSASRRWGGIGHGPRPARQPQSSRLSAHTGCRDRETVHTPLHTHCCRYSTVHSALCTPNRSVARAQEGGLSTM